MVACAKVQTVKAEVKDKGAVKMTGRTLPGLSVRDGYTVHPFDVQFGVRTSGLIAGRHLQTGHRHDRHATAYFGVAPSVFHALIRRWRRSGPAAAINDTTFVDLGAGMGRAVLLASELGFREVVGVELHPALAAMARKNLRLWRAAGRPSTGSGQAFGNGRADSGRGPMRIVEGDAVEFELPEGPLLVFLFNPFGAAVLRRLLKGWRKVLAGRVETVDLLYVNNEQEHVLEGELGWRRLFLGKVRRSKEDAIADYRIMANQPEGEYASSNWEDCSMWRYGG
jgi:SAM-dependent methyltransferase